MFNLHKHMAHRGRLHSLGELMSLLPQRWGSRGKSKSVLRLSKSRTSVPGGKLRGSLGKLHKFPGALLLGMCLLTHGHYVHRGIRRRLCKDHPRPPVHGLLHPRWIGKKNSHYLLLLKVLHATNHHPLPGVNSRWEDWEPGRSSPVV